MWIEYEITSNREKKSIVAQTRIT